MITRTEMILTLLRLKWVPLLLPVALSNHHSNCFRSATRSSEVSETSLVLKLSLTIFNQTRLASAQRIISHRTHTTKTAALALTRRLKSTYSTSMDAQETWMSQVQTATDVNVFSHNPMWTSNRLMNGKRWIRSAPRCQQHHTTSTTLKRTTRPTSIIRQVLVII